MAAVFMLILFCLFIYFCDATTIHPSPPSFSWDTIPLFVHTHGNTSGLLNDSAAQFMASFPISTLSHQQAGPDGPIDICNNSKNMMCEEDAILLGLQKIRSFSSNTRTLFYLNTMLNWPCYNLSTNFFGENEKYLLHYNGNLVYFSDCHPGKPNITIFDLAQNETRNFWLNTIKYALTKYNGVVDGVFADRGKAQLGHDFGCLNWSESQINDWNKGHLMIIQETMNIVKTINNERGLVIPNNADIDNVNGRMFENFQQNDTNGIPPGDDLNIFMNDNGKRIMEIHKDNCNPLNAQKLYNQTLAAYLIGSYKYSYFQCTKDFTLESFWEDTLQNKDYYKPLGPPLMNATYDNATNVYYREFQKGVKVWLDVAWKKPCIKWSDGSITGTTKDCQHYV